MVFFIGFRTSMSSFFYNVLLLKKRVSLQIIPANPNQQPQTSKPKPANPNQQTQTSKPKLANQPKPANPTANPNQPTQKPNPNQYPNQNPNHQNPNPNLHEKLYWHFVVPWEKNFQSAGFWLYLRAYGLFPMVYDYFGGLCRWFMTDLIDFRFQHYWKFLKIQSNVRKEIHEGFDHTPGLNA